MGVGLESLFADKPKGKQILFVKKFYHTCFVWHPWLLRRVKKRRKGKEEKKEAEEIRVKKDANKARLVQKLSRLFAKGWGMGEGFPVKKLLGFFAAFFLFCVSNPGQMGSSERSCCVCLCRLSGGWCRGGGMRQAWGEEGAERSKWRTYVCGLTGKAERAVLGCPQSTPERACCSDRQKVQENCK